MKFKIIMILLNYNLFSKFCIIILLYYFLLIFVFIIVLFKIFQNKIKLKKKLKEVKFNFFLL